ncbi:hypothetical protein L484_014174 [Morus notabilis]|uniref:Cytochrome b561 domain-containing protein n=1 Tax=Morus notabilis TaxID=981085 RepID=W9RJV8_9ROSA|nr:hypothetical protein L484_014174 [Morus notabilis]
MEPKMQLVAHYDSSVDQRVEDTDVTTNLRSWHGRSTPHHRHLKSAHRILIIVGWGTLLPVGVVIARYFQKYPMQWNEWYSFHIMFQSTGYVLGTIGWLIGILAGITSPKQLHADKPDRILGIIIFTFTTIQMLAFTWQPKKLEQGEEHYYRKGWVICHHFLGYVLIALIIAEIFQGIKDQRHATNWKWIYVGILGVLGLIVISLEILRWVRSKIFGEAIRLNSNMYTSSP